MHVDDNQAGTHRGIGIGASNINLLLRDSSQN